MGILETRSGLLAIVAAGALFVPRVDAQATPFAFTKPDRALLEEAREVDRQFENKAALFVDPKLTSYLESVAARVLAGTPAPEQTTYRVRVLRDPMVSAFSLPNGSIYLNTGLLAVLRDEGQLAAVIAHESVHVTFRHGYLVNRALRDKSVAAHVLMTAGSVVPVPLVSLGTAFAGSIMLVSNFSSAVVQTSVVGYGKTMESEADQRALELLEQAGYGYAALTGVLETLDEKLEIEPVVTFYRSHDKLTERHTAVPQAAARDETGERDYLGHVALAIAYNVQADLASRRPRTAIARAARLLRLAPEDASYRTLLADGYRVLGAKSTEPDQPELSRQGRSEERRRVLRLTEAEEQEALLKQPGGPERLASNQAKAEELYAQTIEQSPKWPDAHRGLGMLREDQRRFADAAEEYRRYLETAAPDAPDRRRIQARLQRLPQELNAREPD